MSPGVEELPAGEQPHRQRPRRVRRIDFTELARLSTSADEELRETGDALIAFMERQEKRDRLYLKSRDELKEKYQFGRIGGAA
jgi:hypothetical protein